MSPALHAQEIGDANCDGVVDEADVPALIGRIFAPRDCGDADPNLDGATTAADLCRQVALILVTPTPTETPVPEPTETSTPSLGPLVTYFGLAGSAGRLIPVSEFTDDGVPVVNRTAGTGFKVVIEAAPGITGATVGQILLNSQPGGLPDLQLESSRDLGNGNLAVCAGGVPAVDPPNFAADPFVADAMNDFSCRFSVATIRGATCTLDDFDNPAFARPESRIQFCYQVTANETFGPGDTMLSLRVRDRIGNLGPMTQMIVRLPGLAPTKSPTPSGTATLPPTRTRTPTVTETPPPSATPSRTRTATLTPIAPSPTATATAPQATATRTPTSNAATATATPTRPTATTTPTQVTATPTPTRPTPTITRTPAGPTSTPTATSAGATSTRTATRTPTAGSVTPTRTRTSTFTPTSTPGAAKGPVITFIGLVRADNRYNPGDLIETRPDGTPVYHRPLGTGFVIVVEGKPGTSKRAVGTNSFNSDPGDPSVLPDLQIQVDRDIGDGSPDVCDNMPPTIGGVPAVNPPRFDTSQTIANSINDLSCRFVDGQGAPMARNKMNACILFDDGEFDFFAPTTTTQYCSVVVPQALKFQNGDTQVSARLRDSDGNVGPVARMIVRVAN